MVVHVTLPLRLVSEANQRGSWHAGAKRARTQRGTTRLVLRQRAVALPPAGGPCYVVTLTRIAPRKLDGDNLQRALKAVRDGVADAMWTDDDDERLTWEYAQRKTSEVGALVPLTKGYGVAIVIEARP